MKKLNLTILTQIFYPQAYSTALTLTQLSEVLTEKGVNVKVYTGQPTSFDRDKKYKRIINYKGIKIERVNNTQFDKKNIFGRIINDITFIFMLLLRLLLSKNNGPFLVLTNPPMLGVIAVILKKLRKAKIIFLVFDVYPDTAINLGVLRKGSFIAKMWDFFNKIVYKNSDVIVVIGRCMKNIIVEKMKYLGMDERYLSKVKLIPVWTDDKKFLDFNEVENPMRKEFNIRNRFVVLYSGNMGRFHDLETIMMAANDLNKMYKDIIFLFVGGGYKRKYVEDFIRKHKLKNCIVSDYVSREDHIFVLELANICLLSLEKGQAGLSVPSKAFSYWAMGKPVVGILEENSEIALLLNEYNCGFVVENGKYSDLVKKIMLLYNDENLRKEMSINARKMIKEKYNLNIISEEYIKLIKNLEEK